jgi:hypothetical protein
VPHTVHDVLRSPGRPLDPRTRAFMEPRFGRDFGEVRIHTGANAAASAQAVHALAYTAGYDVVFAHGQFAPETGAGRRLLAHELAHVVQQHGAASGAEVVRRRIDDETASSAAAPPTGGLLPYREATELAECIRIMGEESSDYCYQTVTGRPAGPARAPSITTPLIIILEDVFIVPQFRVVEDTIRQAIEPIANAAGRQLQFARRPPGDLSLLFDLGGRGSGPCTLLILGNEGGGEIFVGAHEELRVCSGPQGTPDNPDYVSQLERVFSRGEAEFARFVGNTAVHELAHLMVQMPHTSDRGNFMHSHPRLGANLPQNLRTLQSMRRHWAGTKTFTAGQILLLQEAIRTGRFTGGMTTTHVPPPTPPTPSRAPP